MPTVVTVRLVTAARPMETETWLAGFTGSSTVFFKVTGVSFISCDSSNLLDQNATFNHELLASK